MEENRALIRELPRGTTDSPVVEEIVKLERRLFPKHESLSSSFYQELGKKNGGLLYCVLLDEGKPKEQVVGYVMYFFPSSLYASVTKLAVRENYRRKGYGEALLKAAIEKCRSRRIQRICLHVDPLRRPALCLYQKLGFQVDSIVESYYSADRDAYRMYLDFDVKK
ncbi:uncharacterized protein LOC116266630 [Nymphaea colorata]|nr:uncharacterized protein LOC116266630 [Nymphaea colorata]